MTKHRKQTTDKQISDRVIGAYLSGAIVDAGLSQTELAKIAGFHRTSVTRMIGGSHSIKLREALLLAAYLPGFRHFIIQQLKEHVAKLESVHTEDPTPETLSGDTATR